MTVMKPTNLLRLMTLLLSCAFSQAALAEGGTCPQGYYPIGGGNAGWSGCAPMYDSGMPVGTTPPAPPNPGPRWEFRWGAIAIDSQKGRFGGADGYRDPRKASRAAVKTCRKNGGGKCKIAIEYYNQCGALVWGDTGVTTSQGPIVDEVVNRTLHACSQQTSNCQVAYAGCSYPVEKEY